jgi:SAM-dependent methyltransferase
MARHQQDWQELAELDPLWAIASSPDKRFGRWEREEFFATGERDVAKVMDALAAHGLEPARGLALDFGCGVGRVSRALAARFDRVVGVDIAPAMIARGRELNADCDDIDLRVNAGGDLAVVGDLRFDFALTRIVLQHQPSRAVARHCVEELIRVLRPGGVLVFQIPVHIPYRYRGLLARRLWQALRRLGVPPAPLYRHLHLHPIRMLFVSPEEARRWVERAGAELVHVAEARGRTGVRQGTFYVRRPSS